METGAAPSEVTAAEAEVEAVAARLRPHFRRRAGHRHAVTYVRGLLGDVERKNGWQLAEHAGYRRVPVRVLRNLVTGGQPGRIEPSCPARFQFAFPFRPRRAWKPLQKAVGAQRAKL